MHPLPKPPTTHPRSRKRLREVSNSPDRPSSRVVSNPNTEASDGSFEVLSGPFVNSAWSAFKPTTRPIHSHNYYRRISLIVMTTNYLRLPPPPAPFHLVSLSSPPSLTRNLQLDAVKIGVASLPSVRSEIKLDERLISHIS